MTMSRRALQRCAAGLFASVCLAGQGMAAASDVRPASRVYTVDNGGARYAAEAFIAELELETGLTAELTGGGEYVATGQVLTLRDEHGAVREEHEVAVMGDVTGSGQAGPAQLVRMAQALRGEITLSEAEMASADLDGSGALDLGDLVSAAAQTRAVITDTNPVAYSDNIPFYYKNTGNMRKIPVYFTGQYADIPYISTRAMQAILNTVSNEDEVGTIALGEPAPCVVEFSRSNGTAARLDFVSEVVSFNNFNRFMLPNYAETELDVVSTSGYTDDGETWYFHREPSSVERSGRPIGVNLGERGIPMYYTGKTGYIPLQTFSDLFLVPNGLQIIYNGRMAGIISSGDPEQLTKTYYSQQPRRRSEQTAEFTYKELCLALDLYYGLSEQHDITSFDSLFEQTGLKRRLCSTDPVQADQALSALANAYLGDLHTQVLYPSWYAGQNANIGSSLSSVAVLDYQGWQKRFADARRAAYPNGVPGYEEIGDTAFVTIDRFSWKNRNYYTNPATENADDTIGLIAYAHSQITRRNSPIRNVVLDLSQSGGGSVDAGIYVLAWFTGKAELSLNDTLTHAQATTVYSADVNMDGRFTEDDTITHLNRYCLISPLSFSCGNMVPAELKADPEVTLLGQESGGGACIVLPLTLADGTILQVSGPRRLSLVSNGSYFDIDKGIQPDVPIGFPEDYYDRDELADRIRGLFR